MSLIEAREIIAFPPGSNDTDTVISGVHFNTTALNYWNYTYYSNGTLSNVSKCYLMFEPYTPVMFSNGTFKNWTSCYSAIEPIGRRSSVGVAFAVAFGLTLLLTLVNLRKHGKRFLPAQKRFTPLGRRWQWYWMSIIAACAMISGLVGVDVDRYYLPELPLVLSNFFWYLMLPSTLACVWESVRHWGSWQERQMVDPNPFMLPQDDKRGRTEFWLPLIFYLFAFLNFFMVIPRPWGRIEKQRSSDQTAAVAEPSATDARFKAAAFFLFLSWIVIVFSLRHSIYHYKPRNRGLHNKFAGFIRYTPLRLIMSISLALVVIAYDAFCAFDFGVSSLNLHANPAWIYGWGWSPILLIIIIYNIYGFLEPNEDLELIRQRRARGADIDREMGLTKKPAWWRRMAHGPDPTNIQEHLAANARELGGGAPTTRNLERSIEMGNMPVSKKNEARTSSSLVNQESTIRPPMNHNDSNRRLLSTAANMLFPTTSYTSMLNEEPSEQYQDEETRGRNDRPGSSGRSASSGTEGSVSAGASPQQIRSMLDV